jgi:stearoyl-CoA desaturase (delta-9 desaturase)
MKGPFGTLSGAGLDNKGRWSLLNASFLLGTLGLALVLVPLELRHSFGHWGEWVVLLVMLNLIGTGVTAGYHRLFSHRAYEASWPVRFTLLCLAAASFENSALHWCSDHRIHHRHVDQDLDPYNSTRGFWFAHWLWVMEKGGHPIQGVADLQKDPLVRWQHRHHFLIGGIVSLSLPVAVGLATHNLWGNLVIGLLLRIVITHHSTFLINSAAHMFGSRPYTDSNTARDNALLAPLTYGEGYHNFHHMWQWDYRNGVRWYQWDTTKWMLRALAVVGLVRGLRRVPAQEIHRARLRMEEKALLAKLAEVPDPGSVRARVTAARERLDQALAAFQAQREAWEQGKAARQSHRTESWLELKAELKAAAVQRRAELRLAFGEWKAARLAVRRTAAA